METFHSTLFLEFCIHCILICTPALAPLVDPYRQHVYLYTFAHPDHEYLLTMNKYAI